MSNNITRRAVLARTPAAIAAASLPAVASASADDAHLIAVVDEYLRFNASWNADKSDYGDEEHDARGERSSALYEEIMQTPARTLHGVLAKAVALTDVMDDEGQDDLSSALDVDDEYLASCYRRDGSYFDDWGVHSVFADLIRLSRAGGVS